LTWQCGKKWHAAKACKKKHPQTTQKHAKKLLTKIHDNDLYKMMFMQRSLGEFQNIVTMTLLNALQGLEARTS
jgi:hypothetical protein